MNVATSGNRAGNGQEAAGENGLEARSNLTRSQFLIWAGQKLAPSTPHYNMGWRFDLPLPVDAAAFGRAFEAVVRCCESLRTVIEERDGVPYARVLPVAAGKLDFVTLQGDEEAREWLDARMRRSFALPEETLDAALITLRDGRSIWFLNQHHLVTDAATGAIIFDAVARTYDAEIEGAPADDAPLPALSAYVDQERRGRNSEDAAFWAERNAAGTPPPSLYGAPPIGAGHAGSRLFVDLGSARARALRELAREKGFQSFTPHVSLFNILATALAAWTARVSGQQSFAIGAMSHGRTTPEARRTAGPLVELLPLEASLVEGETFRTLHGKMVEEAFNLLRHASPGASTAEGHGRFNAVLNYLPVRFGRFGDAAPRVEWLYPGCSDPKHLLRLSVVDFDDSGNLALYLDVNDSLGASCPPERLAEHFLRLLDAFLGAPDSRIDQVALADPAEASARLAASAAGACAETGPATDVLEAFRARMADDPDRRFLVDDNGALSWREIDTWSSAIAESLAREGVTPESLVGVNLTRSAELVAVLIGTLKAGAAFVPLDPTQPPARLDTVVEEARLRLVVTEKRLRPHWQAAVPRLEIDDLPRRPSDSWRAMAPAPEAPAYVIFTSGSTGVPKGVRIGRAALARYAAWAHTVFAYGKPKVWSLHSPTGFDLTITSIFAPLVGGGSIRAYREALDGPDLSVLRVFADDAVDVVKLTPAHLRLVVEAGEPVRRIGTLVLGGEDLTVALSGQTRAVLGDHIEILNEYGPTEATVGCMIHRYDPAADTGASVPIGRPAEATGIYVLDAGLNPVPDNVVGELYIGGVDRLADGYQNLAQETAKRFLSDPFLPGRRMYKSGDLASVTADGVVRYHGRRDEQIKIRGVRIELAEIRQMVLAHSGVTDCVLDLIEPTAPASARCRECGLGADYPEVEIDETGLCGICRDYAAYKEKAAAYFRSMDELRSVVERAGQRKTGRYDCLMLFSGGKDSTYALCRMAELTPRILAATLDNGFLSDEAKANITRVTEALGIEHRFMTTPAMNAIFVDSLKRHANVCNGCFKTIYTLGLKTARDEGIPLIVTGLSRGQLFETRLAPELFKRPAVDVGEIDRFVLEARKTYHRVEDTAARLLNKDLFRTDAIFSEVEFVDFYRYCDVPLDEVYAYLRARAPWSRPKDTGRSTNCLINDVGIHVHKRRRGYHNYALPYSWDVRMGHKTRDAALHELDDEINEDRVAAILEQIGFDEDVDPPGAGEPRLVCYFTARDAVGPADLRRSLAERLPREMIPATFSQVPSIPLTANGKVDRAALSALPKINAASSDARPVAPRDAAERQLYGIWREILRLESLGVEDNFFELGGDSIAAIRIASRATEAGLAINATDVFSHQTVAALARALGSARAPAPEAAAPPRLALDEKARSRLSALFGTRPDE